MGGAYNFCYCKESKEGDDTNIGFFDDINSALCPVKKVPTKKDFTFNSQIQALTIDDYKKKSAVNKIIKIYREYKQNQNIR